MLFTNSEKTRLKKKYGPWALVTGASSGIGLELADRLAESGINLIINSRNPERLDIISHRLRAQYAVEVVSVAADLEQREGSALLIESTKNKEIGLLIANAGFGTSGEFIHSNLEHELSMIKVNCEAVLILVHHFAKQFALNKRGGIILMSSIVAFQGVTYAGHYGASKAYIQSLGEALYEELKPYQVDVLVPVPGPVESKFGDRANMNLSGAMKPAQIGVPILKALGRSKSVLPGFLSKILVNSLRIVPRWAKIKIMKLVMGGMTRHQRNKNIFSPL